ncbi:MAG: dehydrogenase [Actinomycetales bacterium]|nr:dehydrogenase [Actinomycetales bacterium]
MNAPPIDPERLDALAATWTVLSRLLLSPPDEDTLTRFRDPEMLASWPFAGHDEDTDAGLALIAGSGEDAEAIRADHAALFTGPDTLRAPPYESVHRSRDHLLFEEETIQVRQWYARHHLAAPRLGREPDDHIGLELDFLATLVLRALQALDAGHADDARRLLADHDEFVTTHLLEWAPGLMDLVRARAGTDFYRGVGALGSGVLRAPQALLS